MQNANPSSANRAERMRSSRASALALRAAYPGVQQLRLELSFCGASTHEPAAQSHLLYPAARAFFEFPCPHSGCDGQFDLSAVVARAVADEGDGAAGTMTCTGSRPHPHNSRQPCGLRMSYSVVALY